MTTSNLMVLDTTAEAKAKLAAELMADLMRSRYVDLTGAQLGQRVKFHAMRTRSNSYWTLYVYELATGDSSIVGLRSSRALARWAVDKITDLEWLPLG